MEAEARQLKVEAWTAGEGVALEYYRYPPGPAESTPKHSHDEYQLCLGLDFPGRYRYRGKQLAVPVGSLTVVHPGEAHSASDPHDRQTPSTWRLLYVEPKLMAEAASEVAGREKGEPFLPEPVATDGDLVAEFLGLHLALEGSAEKLERDSRLLMALARLVERRAERAPLRRRGFGRERRAVRLAREYLEDNLAENVSLEELSREADLSPYHLSRVFAAEVGLPPHAYQVQARLRRAKDLLLRGWPASRVAFEVGFADQNHFARHFKRLVGVPPGSYARRRSKG